MLTVNFSTRNSKKSFQNNLWFILRKIAPTILCKGYMEVVCLFYRTAIKKFAYRLK